MCFNGKAQIQLNFSALRVHLEREALAQSTEARKGSTTSNQDHPSSTRETCPEHSSIPLRIQNKS